MKTEDLPKPLKPLNISVSVESEDIFENTVNVANHYKIQLERKKKKTLKNCINRYSFPYFESVKFV